MGWYFTCPPLFLVRNHFFLISLISASLGAPWRGLPSPGTGLAEGGLVARLVPPPLGRFAARPAPAGGSFFQFSKKKKRPTSRGSNPRPSAWRHVVTPNRLRDFFEPRRVSFCLRTCHERPKFSRRGGMFHPSGEFLFLCVFFNAPLRGQTDT